MKSFVYYLASFLEAFDISGGAIMGIWSLSIIALCVIATLKGLMIQDIVMYLYFAVLTAFTGTKINGKWVEVVRAGKVVPPGVDAPAPQPGSEFKGG